MTIREHLIEPAPHLLPPKKGPIVIATVFFNVNTTNPERLSEDRLVTKKQAAERLAVSTRTIDRMVAMRRLEKIFVGPSPRFRKSDLDRIVERGI